MKRVTLISIMLVCTLFSFSQTIHSNYLDGEIWIKLNENSLQYRSLNFEGSENKHPKIDYKQFDFIKLIDKYTIQSFEESFPNAKQPLIKNVFRIKFQEISEVDRIIEVLSAHPNIEYAEKIPLLKNTLVPNDTYYQSYQWSLPQVNAETAWDISTGNSSIKVAIVDDAVETTHDDLSSVIYTNTGEIPNNGIDDDNNGYVDDYRGYDVANDDTDPDPDGPSYGHGTHVAGISGAATNNGGGVASIGNGVSIIPVKATNSASVVSHGYEGIYYAMSLNADVINMSWGGSGYSTTAENLINAAYNNGSILVAAAGNDDVSTVFYPAGFSNVIAVASTDNSDNKSSFSNYGSWIDVSAPGSGIVSTVIGNSYDYKSGTSMASPMVAGLAGLILSHNSGLTQSEVKDCILNTAADLNALNPSYSGELGAGRIDALAAMNCVDATLANPPNTDFLADITTITEGQNVNYTDLTSGNPTSWTWTFSGGTPGTFTGQNPPAITYNTAGTYNVTLETSNAYGTDTETKTAYINVNALSGCDTISNTIASDANSIYTFGPGNGYIFGDNLLKFKYVADRFSSYGPTNVTGAVFNFVEASYTSSASKITIKVWEDAGGEPGTNVYSKDVLIEDIAANITSTGFFPTNINFDSPVNISTNDFFVGFEMYDVHGDTVVLSSSSDLSSDPGRSNSAFSFVDPANNPQSTLTGWNEIGSFINGGFEAALHIYPRITANPPLANITASSTSVCSGEAVQFDASSSSNLATVEWAINGTATPYPTGVNPSVIMSRVGNNRAYLLVRNSCGFSSLDSLDITVDETPNVAVDVPQYVICPGGSVSLTATGAGSYVWSPAGSLSCSNCPNPVATPTTTTTYSVVGTSGSCSSVSSFTIEVDSSPVNADFEIDNNTVCVGESINVNAANLSTGAQSYSWTFTGGTPNTAIGALATTSFSSTGTYNVQLEVENACGVTDDITKSVTVVDGGGCTNALTDENKDLYKIYFNSADNELVIMSNLKGQAYLINPAGQIISDNLTFDKGENKLALPNLAKGMYILKTNNIHGQVRSFKFIK
ncbi:hypothetical protein CW751_13185 [Brumimicrobium salinarum]|uniref:PKD domain-containing protein n=1 Tax=Brumimicrobium salinarum TaxID=2058658 RepID=A0A2I0QZL8_9FLAO|nr:S8 family serine peptidase [Brumimicrobium salinarum]PKR79781.1 hypothetical protein CW751_13185 [Brumimicrobium salinarum]